MLADWIESNGKPSQPSHNNNLSQSLPFLRSHAPKPQHKKASPAKKATLHKDKKPAQAKIVAKKNPAKPKAMDVEEVDDVISEDGDSEIVLPPKKLSDADLDDLGSHSSTRFQEKMRLQKLRLALEKERAREDEEERDRLERKKKKSKIYEDIDDMISDRIASL
jgi:hypothetical protein